MEQDPLQHSPPVEQESRLAPQAPGSSVVVAGGASVVVAEPVVVAPVVVAGPGPPTQDSKRHFNPPPPQLDPSDLPSHVPDVDPSVQMSAPDKSLSLIHNWLTTIKTGWSVGAGVVGGGLGGGVG